MRLRGHSKIAVVVLLLVLASLPARAQSAKKRGGHFARNAVYVEAFGPGLFYSLNYERRITENISLRGGFTAYTFLVGFPVMVNALLGQDGDYFEIGIGVVPYYGFGSDLLPFASSSYIKMGNGLMYGTAAMGYRYQPYDGGFLFGIEFTAFFAHHNTFWPWGGVSIGYAF